MAAPFSLIDMLGALAPDIRVVDVGAADIGEGTPYRPLFERSLGRLVAFEPDDQARDHLNASGQFGGRCTFLPDIIGDGTERDFHICNFPMTSSLYPPNTPLLGLFQNLEELTRVVSKPRVKTRRLDDIAPIERMDYLKIDVQGAELDVFRGAPRLLANAQVIHTEVEFVPMYQGQPLFSDVDLYLRSQGFILHSFLGLCGRTFKPLTINDNPNAGLYQHLWSDVLYVRDFTRLHTLNAPDLLRMAIILHECYGSYDLAALALHHYDVKSSGDAAPFAHGVWGEYFLRLCGAIPPERPRV